MVSVERYERSTERGSKGSNLNGRRVYTGREKEYRKMTLWRLWS